MVENFEWADNEGRSLFDKGSTNIEKVGEANA